jgi:predicted nucleotidyltransferase component of viral defense system
MTGITGLNDVEAAAVADEFGVALNQVRRDHLISHVLAALGAHADQLLFFGGTALARTYLPRGRLSEDIDLIATGDRREVARLLSATVSRALRATYGSVTWSAPLEKLRDVEPAILSTDDGLAVRIQLLSSTGYPPWPSEPHEVHQRFSDAPPVRLQVPTRDAFAGWKTSAWLDRAAPRDLYDLWALALLGGMTEAAAELFSKHGPTSAPPRPWMFSIAPEQRKWHEQLAGQTRLTVTAPEALQTVRTAWARVTEHEDEDP